MLVPDFPDKDTIRFPKIGHKAKSVPGSKRQQMQINGITAKSWLYSTPNAMHGYKSDVKRQIASLTKIMTAYCALQLCEKYSIIPKTTYFKITQWVADTPGTSARLIENAWMSVQDLLHGLMLPSGNDAAAALAQNLGAVLYFDKNGSQLITQKEIRSIDLTEDYESVKYYTHEFINYMNSKCKVWKMHRTRFANPHGLDSLNNYSCCQDLLTMCQQAAKNPDFRKIVSTMSYKGTFKFFKDGKVVCKPANWSNTNKLLDKKDICGIKTGITPKAGGCLATMFQIDHLSQGIIVVLGCASTESRFKDTIRILNWASTQENVYM